MLRSLSYRGGKGRDRFLTTRSIGGENRHLPVTTVAATLALVLLGSVSLGSLPVSLLPDVLLPLLTVRTAYPGAAAAEVSRLVAEQAGFVVA